MPEDDSLRNSGPWFRRLVQYLGLVYNDDGTVEPLHLESARGRQVMAQTEAKRRKRP